MLAVHGLFADSQLRSDLLPRPPKLPSAIHMQGLELLEEPPQGSDRSQPLLRVGASHVTGQVNCCSHIVSLG